jgi:hypothetical protein
VKNAGTCEICTTCASHREHYNGGLYGDEALRDDKGWFYCDRIHEVEDFLGTLSTRSIGQGACPWYGKGRTTHQTPLVGVRQALDLGWKPGPVNDPNSGPDPLVVAKRAFVEKHFGWVTNPPAGESQPQ